MAECWFTNQVVVGSSSFPVTYFVVFYEKKRRLMFKNSSPYSVFYNAYNNNNILVPICKMETQQIV